MALLLVALAASLAADVADPPSMWSTLGDGPSFNGRVRAIVTDEEGTLYVGGDFTEVEGSPASRLAVLDESGWRTLGEGLDGPVHALAVDGQRVYAGGAFTSAGGRPALGVACWDGLEWQALGPGFNGPVHALAMLEGHLIAGGMFDRAGFLTVNHIARWDGRGWNPLGDGVCATVRALVVSGTTLYAGGDFAFASGVTTNRVAAWDGSEWTGLGSGLNDRVHALATTPDGLVAGGEFTHSGPATARHVAVWDGTTWSEPGGGINGPVAAVASWEEGFIASGPFTASGGGPVNHIARWDGVAWLPLEAGLSDLGRTLAVIGNDLYVGGDFAFAGSVEAGFAAHAMLVPSNRMVVEQPPGTVFRATELDFGPTALGDAWNFREFSIVNRGTRPLSLGPPALVDSPGVFWLTPIVLGSLDPGERFTFRVGFSPVDLSESTATLRIETDDPELPEFSVLLSGSGTTAEARFGHAAVEAGLFGAEADFGAVPFGDGLPNLLKYAFNLNLADADFRSMPPGGEAGLPRTVRHATREGPVLRFEFVVRKGAGLRYSPQTSATLGHGSFIEVDAPWTIEDIDNRWCRVHVDVPIEPATRPRLFGRLEVTFDGGETSLP